MSEIIVGRTEVVVKKRDVSETGREGVKTIHKGIILQNFGNRFVRVFNPAGSDKGGDTAPENSELFPVNSKYCWIEITHTRPENESYPIPTLLR
jgi:hypothetical protein